MQKRNITLVLGVVLLVGSLLILLAILSGGGVQLVTLLALLLALVSVGLIYFQLRGLPQNQAITLTDTEQSQVNVRKEVVQRLIEHTVSNNPDVTGVSSDLAMTNQGLNVRCHIKVDDGADVIQVKRDLATQIEREVKRHLNIDVADIGIWTDLVENEPEKNQVEQGDTDLAGKDVVIIDNNGEFVGEEDPDQRRTKIVEPRL